MKVNRSRSALEEDIQKLNDYPAKYYEDHDEVVASSHELQIESENEVYPKDARKTYNQ